MENVKVLRSIFTVFGIALLVTSILIYLYRISFDKYNDNSRMLLHTLKVQEKTEELLGKIKGADAGIRDYIITEETSFLVPYNLAKSTLVNTITELHNLTIDNTFQTHLLTRIEFWINKKLVTMDFIIQLKKSNNFESEYKDLFLESNAAMDSIRTLTSKMKAEGNRVRIIRDLEVREATRYSNVLSTIFSFTAISIMIISLLYILWEIRSKKKVKNLLATVLESSQSGIMSFVAKRNKEGNIEDFEFIQVNKIALQMLNKSLSDLIGKSLLRNFPGNKEEGLFDSYVDVTENNSVLKIEKYYNKDNLNFWFRIVAIKLDDGFTVTFDDISKEKGYEEELKNFIFDLKRSNDDLEQFAFAASHDLQEPLRKIQTFGDRLRNVEHASMSENSLIYIEKMLAAASRMSKLINDLLSFSRLAKTTEQYTKIDLNKVLEDVKIDLELVIQSKNALIHSQKLPEIEGISSQLYQLLYNIIGNALKFTRQDVTPEIYITTEIYSGHNPMYTTVSNDSKDTFVRIKVSDNGIGFDDLYKERIFEIFQRLHGKSEFEGTGMGLAICKRIVANHHGTIVALGNQNEGTVFIIELPLVQNN